MLKKMMLLGLFLIFTASAAEKKKAVLVARSADDKVLSKSLLQFERLLTAELVESGFKVIDRKLILEKFKSTPLKVAELDDAAAMAIATTLDSEFLIVADMISIGKERTQFSGFDIKSAIDLNTMRTSLSVYDCSDRASLFAGNVVYDYKQESTENLKVADSDLIGKMLAGSVEKIGEAVKQNVARFEKANKAGIEWVNVTVNSSIPNSDISVDGIVVGTSANEIKVPKGIHLLKVEREWFSPWEKNVNFFPGQTLNIDLKMSDKGFAHYQKTELFTEKMAKLSQDRKVEKAEKEVAMEVAKEIAEAQAQAVKDIAEGRKEMFKKVKIDISTDLKELTIGNDDKEKVIIIKEEK